MEPNNLDVEEYRGMLYDRYLPLLTLHLNRAHGENHSQRYWELLVGAWLKHFLYHAHYRYQKLHGTSKAANPLILKRLILPFDFVSFVLMFEETDYANQLEALLAESVDPEQVHCWESIQISQEQVRQLSMLKRSIKNLVFEISAKICRWIFRSAQVVMVSPSVKPKTVLKICWSSKFKIVPLFFKMVAKDLTPINQDLRKWLAPIPEAGDPFDRILRKILLSQLPQIHLEGYASLKRRLKDLTSRFQVIFSAMGWHQDELFKIFSAVRAEQGARLISHQHGGLYGLAKTKVNEHEEGVTDLFLTWGWNGSRKTKPFISLKLSEIAQYFQKLPKHPEEILFLSSTENRHIPDGWGVPFGELSQRYWSLQLEFLRDLSEHAREKFVIRPYPNDCCEREPDPSSRWADLNLKCRNSDLLVEAFSKAKLVVADNNSTTFLESYACDIPTVIFFDPELWPLHERTIELFGEMERVGLFHKSPRSAARHINEIHQDPRNWWDFPNVKIVREKFRKQFARSSSTFTKDIAEFLLLEARS